VAGMIRYGKWPLNDTRTQSHITGGGIDTKYVANKSKTITD